MSDIADFLRARYQEQRQLAIAAKNDGEGKWDFFPEPAKPGDDPVEYRASINRALHIGAHQPDAVIADCDAKLAFIDHCEKVQAYAEGERRQEYVLAAGACAVGLEILAQVFAGQSGSQR